MVTYLFDYEDSVYSTSPLDIYNGTVRVSSGTNYGTGALLYDGRSILTAAHIFDEDDTRGRVYFDTPGGSVEYGGTLSFYDHYDAFNSNGDLAIITLDEHVASGYGRYEIYRDFNEIGQEFTMAGYGNNGSGYTGEITDSAENLKLKTQNTFDTDFYAISQNSNLLWEPLEDAVLAADFDNGTGTNDALGYIMGLDHTGVGLMEGLIAGGDSGGPAFIDMKVAGVANYTTSIGSVMNSTDINDLQDSSFGEIGAWQRVSYFQEWIDKTLRANYPDAPLSRDDVETSVVETDGRVTYAYFFLEYTADRTLIEDNITLSYTTKDGTATAGEDYIAVSGTVTLYPDESSVPIPVEIIGDNISEDDEYFYLEVSSPSHGSFGEGVVSLTAARTILDDDGSFA